MTPNRSFQNLSSRRVSFIIATKNRFEFIGKALEMTRELLGPEDELIVVDGASTDGTAEVVASFGGLIDTFISEPDVSPSHALNKGMLVARGKYIKQITDDDEYFPDAMEQAIEVLEGHPEVDVLLCGGIRQIGATKSPVYMSSGVNFGKSPEDVFKYGVCGCGFLFRRSVLSQIGLQSSMSIAADGEYIARAIYRGATVKFCRINLFHHPIYEYSTIIKQYGAWKQDMDRIAKRYCSRGFYLKYRMKNAVHRFPVTRVPASALRNALRTVQARLGSSSAHATASSESPTWDGGFS